MLDSLARFVYRRRRAGRRSGRPSSSCSPAPSGRRSRSHLDPYGSDDPATDSVKAENLLEAHGYRDSSVIVLVQDAPVASPATRSRVQGIERQLRARSDVSAVSGYYDTGSRAFVSRRRHERPISPSRSVPPRTSAPRRRVEHRGSAERRAGRHRRRLRAGPGAGQQAGRVRPAEGRDARLPPPLPALADLLPQPRGGAPAAAGRRPGDRRHVLHPPDRERVRLDLDLRPQPDHRPRAGTGDRLQPVHRLALPRGAGPRLGPGADGARRRARR